MILKSLSIVVVVAATAAVGSAAALGCVAGVFGLGFTWAVVPVGLVTGLAVRIAQREPLAASRYVVVLASLGALVLHVYVVSVTPKRYAVQTRLSEGAQRYIAQEYLGNTMARTRQVRSAADEQERKAALAAERNNTAQAARTPATKAAPHVTRPANSKSLEMRDNIILSIWKYGPPTFFSLATVVLAVGALELQWRRRPTPAIEAMEES